MFEDRPPEWWRKVTQEDMIAPAVRVALAAAGPFGAVIGEFATQVIPKQRLDRIQDFIEQLNERLAGLEDQVRERLTVSAAFTALAEEVTMAAARAPGSQRRQDLAAILEHGLSRSDAELIEELALLRLLDSLNEPQLLILMSYGSFGQGFGNVERSTFQQQHSGVFGVAPPSLRGSQDEVRRWAMHNHYQNELVQSGLLEDTEGVAKSGPIRQLRITELGRMLLRAIGRPVAR